MHVLAATASSQGAGVALQSLCRLCRGTEMVLLFLGTHRTQAGHVSGSLVRNNGCEMHHPVPVHSLWDGITIIMPAHTWQRPTCFSGGPTQGGD